MKSPVNKLRRFCKTKDISQLAIKTPLSVSDLVMPLFIIPGANLRQTIKAMPGIERMSVDIIAKESAKLYSAGIGAVLLFGVPENKDEKAKSSYDDQGLVQKAVRQIKKEVSDMVVITDVCLCSYTSNGHCGVLDKDGVSRNEKLTRDLLSKMALSHVAAGADIVAPSAVLEGEVEAIRKVLDNNRFSDVLIMGYSAKFASSFYGPFREAVNSSFDRSKKRSYQYDCDSIDQALEKVDKDIAQGADIVMVKPALSYLDVVAKLKQKFNHALAVYNVSGEYSIVKSGVKNGFWDEKAIVYEILTSIKRSGADFIITYHAKDAVRWLNKDKDEAR